MRARSVVVACAAVAAMFAIGSGSASANLAWCVNDPPIQVITPGGHTLTVNNQVFLPASDLHLRNQVYDDATAAPDGHGGTLVTVHVHVPSQGHVVSSENRYRLTTEDSGTSVITTYLDVPTT